ncbi:MAG: zinc ABC transporter substrate-binding protein, partial [Pirellulaceae bacterium]|nr:zinc ABC transporter substrate-binding protein [Pirellulaceae bacterium]
GCSPTSTPPAEPDVRRDPSAPPRAAGEQPSLAVSNSYLGAAVHDVLGQDAPVMLLAEPGMCPGHFDLRPSQVQQLRACRLLLRFDFQQSLDARLGDAGQPGPRVLAVQVPGGMCVPDSYQSVCGQVADALVADGRLSREAADARLAAVAQRLSELNAWTADQLDRAALRDAAVLCSGHQAAFCRHLGLNVVATFSAADTAQPSQIDQAVKVGEQARVKLIVANLPEGRQLADALGDRLGAPVVVFGNFPQKLEPQAFEQLVRGNVTALVEAGKP